MGAFVTDGSVGTGAIEAGVGVLWVTSDICEGSAVTGGRVGWGAEFGTLVAVMTADNLSSFFSISDTRVGVCTMVLGFAGLLRATCSIHSTRAFWHLKHVLCRDRKCIRIKHTFDRCQRSRRAHIEPCACGSARRQTSFLSFPLARPWRQKSGQRVHRRSPRVGGEVRSCQAPEVGRHTADT